MAVDDDGGAPSSTLPQKRKSDDVATPPPSAFAFAKSPQSEAGQPKKARSERQEGATPASTSKSAVQFQHSRIEPWVTTTPNSGGREQDKLIRQPPLSLSASSKRPDRNSIQMETPTIARTHASDQDEKATVRSRANPFATSSDGVVAASPHTTQKIFEQEQAKIEAKIQRDQLTLWQKFKSFFHVSFWTIVWFTVNHFTQICIAALIFMALWPDHYFELDLTPARLLLGIALIHIANTWWAAMPKWFKDYAQGIKEKNPNPKGPASKIGGTSTAKDRSGTPKSGGQNLSRSIYDASTGSNDSPSSIEELSSPTTIMAKLQTLFDVMTQQLGEDQSLMPRHKVYVCVLAFLDLLRELYHVKPDWYDIQLRKDKGKIPEYFASGNANGNTAVAAAAAATNAGKNFWDDLSLYLEMSDLAYQTSLTELIDQLHPLGYQLIRQDLATEPGRVGHFIAVNYEKMNVVIAIKGTSSVGDVLTDLIGHSVPHELTGKVWKQIRCHEGMYSATKLMLQETTHLVSEFFIPSGYTITICGHSLGAGVSCLLGIFLKDKTGISPERLKVYAFATPACLSYDAALECQDFVTSVINNADCVPRASMINVKTLFKFFLKIYHKLEETGKSPKDWTSTAAFWQEVTSVDTDPLFTVEEMVEFQESMIARANETELDGEYALFVPGKVIHMWESSDGSVDCRELHGGLNTLRELQVYPSMISDHGTAEYKKNLNALLSKARNDT